MSELNVPERISAIAAIGEQELKIGTAGVVEVPADFAEKLLPEGLTMETVEAVQDLTGEVVSGLGLALGNLGIKAFKKDPKLEQVSASFKFGKDVHNATFQRVREVPINRPGEERKTAPKYGVLSNSVTVHGAGNKGNLRKVRQHLSAEAAKVLAG